MVCESVTQIYHFSSIYTAYCLIYTDHNCQKVIIFCSSNKSLNWHWLWRSQVQFEYLNLFQSHNEASQTVVTEVVTYITYHKLHIIAQWNCVYLCKIGIVALFRALCRLYPVLGARVHNTFLSRLNGSNSLGQFLWFYFIRTGNGLLKRLKRRRPKLMRRSERFNAQIGYIETWD